jgi:hypothetical protein
MVVVEFSMNGYLGVLRTWSFEFFMSGYLAWRRVVNFTSFSATKNCVIRYSTSYCSTCDVLNATDVFCPFRRYILWIRMHELKRSVIDIIVLACCFVLQGRNCIHAVYVQYLYSITHSSKVYSY